MGKRLKSLLKGKDGNVRATKVRTFNKAGKSRLQEERCKDYVQLKLETLNAKMKIYRSFQSRMSNEQAQKTLAEPYVLK